jgi:general secretion pathway protein I
MMRRSQDGFTLVEVLVALVVVAIGLAALMIAVSGTARTSGYLRDKTLAQWIALNRIAEVRLTVNKQATSSGSSSSSNGDTGQLQFAGRTWHYDTRYFDTTFQSTKRIVVRVWAGDAKTKGNPLAEAMGFFGTALSTAGNSNALDWTQGSTASTANCQSPGSSLAGGNLVNPSANGMANCAPGNPPVTTPTVTTTPGRGTQ